MRGREMKSGEREGTYRSNGKGRREVEGEGKGSIG
jgi:hypothetical protein